jgi:hypothetical protein
VRLVVPLIKAQQLALDLGGGRRAKAQAPPGYHPAPNSKKGAWRKRKPRGGWDYWDPESAGKAKKAKAKKAKAKKKAKPKAKKAPPRASTSLRTQPEPRPAPKPKTEPEGPSGVQRAASIMRSDIIREVLPWSEAIERLRGYLVDQRRDPDADLGEAVSLLREYMRAWERDTGERLYEEPPGQNTLPTRTMAREDALRYGKITHRGPLGGGITDTEKVTIEHDGQTYTAVWKPLYSREDTGFYENWTRNEALASELDDALTSLGVGSGMRHVPPTVTRKIGSDYGSLQAWADGADTVSDLSKRGWLLDDRDSVKHLPNNLGARRMVLLDLIMAAEDRHSNNAMVVTRRGDSPSKGTFVAIDNGYCMPPGGNSRDNGFKTPFKSAPASTQRRMLIQSAEDHEALKRLNLGDFNDMMKKIGVPIVERYAALARLDLLQRERRAVIKHEDAAKARWLHDTEDRGRGAPLTHPDNRSMWTRYVVKEWFKECQRHEGSHAFYERMTSVMGAEDYNDRTTLAKHVKHQRSFGVFG